MAPKPDAFLSYTRFDDEDGEISAFRQRLSRTVRQVSGEPFTIFQDVDDEAGIGLGERWKDKLDEMLDQARFFIPILTPSFFRSDPCRQELRTFLDLEHKVGRRDLVLPIYWISCPVLDEGYLKAKDELAQEIDERQRWDWRELIFEDLKSPACRRELQALSIQIERARRNVLRVVEAAEPGVVGEATGRNTASSKPPAAVKSKSTPKKAKPTKTLWTPGEVFRDIDELWCPEMVKIPAGTFFMGSPEDEEGRFNNEGPRHEVTISQDFTLGRYPVTFEEYDHFCEATGSEKPIDRGWGRGRRPVINVSHYDAEACCAWLSGITKANYRLPTEAEWEYACRAHRRSAYAFGDEISEKQANFGRNLGKISEVGAYPANDWSLHDMHGNVWEWCADGLRFYTQDAVVDPKGKLARSAWCAVAPGTTTRGTHARRAASRSIRAAGTSTSAFVVPEFRGRQARHRSGGQGVERSRSPDSPTGRRRSPNEIHQTGQASGWSPRCRRQGQLNSELTSIGYPFHPGPCGPGNPPTRQEVRARLGLPGSHGPARRPLLSKS